MRRSNVFILLASLVLMALPNYSWAALSANVRVDQIGYLPTESKYGMVAGGAPTGAFNIRKVSDNSSVFTGTLAGAFTDADSGDSIRTADFSSFVTPGSYYLDVAGVGQSYNFDIGANAFQSSYVMAVRGFYSQRCGMAVDMGTVDGVHYQHPACHISGGASDNLASYHSSSGKSGTVDEVGGWHDAGDYGKYIVNSGISTGELLWTWECWSDRLTGVSSNIPESGNGTPDVLNEARWNLKWMLKMQDSDGGVWHKDTSAGFGSFVLPNLDDSGTRYVIGKGSSPYKTSCATADFAAVMATAARLFQPYDASFASTCLTAAQNAWTWVVANPNVTFSNPAGISTGGYGDGNCADERLWAAAELFRTTGTATYNSYVVANAPAGTLFGTGLQQDWANVQNLALWTYYFSGQASANAALRTRIYNDTLSAATTIANRTNGASNGYKVSLNGSGQYIWGSNGAVANYAILLLLADKMSPNSSYTNAALNNLHYLLGRNTFDTSYVTHVGENPYLHPHHRPSGDPAYSGGAPWPGLLSGGPNSTGSTSGDGLTPANSRGAKCWIDVQGAYASNEIAINWQAPLVFLLAYTLPVPVTGSPTPTPTFTRSPTASPSPTPLPCGTATNLRRVNVGGTAFSGAQTWSADQAYSPGGWGYVAAGTTSTDANAIAGTSDDALYQAQRWAGNLQYNFTVPNGVYTVTVKLAETYWTASGQRVMAVAAEGSTVMSGVDIFASAPGAERAYDLSFVVNVSDGVLNLSFTGSTDNASVAGISIDSAVSGPCATSTSTATRTATRTSTRTETRTATRTATRSDTPSGTPTATRTQTPSATSTPTSTRTPSASPSATRSATQSSTPSQTPTASPTLTITWTYTDVPVGSTDTDTPTISPTRTASPTVTPTASRTATPTASQTATATASPSETSTVTPSLTASPSPSLTATDSPIASATSTETVTPSFSASPSSTDTASLTATLTVTPSLSPSPIATATVTPWVPSISSLNPTNGSSAGGWTLTVDGSNFISGAQVVIDGTAYSATFVSASQLQLTAPALTAGTLTLTVLNPGNVASDNSATLVIAGPLAPTATPLPDDGPLHIEQAVFHPHPVHGPVIQLRFKLSGHADRVQLKIYSRAFICVATLEAQGNYQRGWNSVGFVDAELGNGAWFCQINAFNGVQQSLRMPPLRLYKLR